MKSPDAKHSAIHRLLAVSRHVPMARDKQPVDHDHKPAKLKAAPVAVNRQLAAKASESTGRPC